MSLRAMIAALSVSCLATLAPERLVAQVAQRAEGARIFAASCASCHSEAQSGRTPSRFSLSGLSPRAILAALEAGTMKAEGEKLTREQRISIAEALTGRAFSRTLLPEGAFCATLGPAPLNVSAIASQGFGGNLQGTGFQTAERAGLTAADIPKLQLRWAFAFPDAVQTRTKPTIAGDVILVGGPFGEVLALEAATGCVRWAFEADSGVRGSILVEADRTGRTVAYFVDFRTSAYALDVATGNLLWKTRVGRHPESNTTGSPALHDGKLIVPISTMEVVTAQSPAYACCTASGAVAALNSTTGAVLWYHRVIPDDAREVGRNAAGTPIMAPSGAPVWSSPTIDVRRGLVYVGTGESYTRPAAKTSDAILAIELATGKLSWSFQGTADDAFTMACTTPRNRENCPAPPGPDLDFGMAPILVVRPDGKDILVAGQKSGVVWALDPDAKGAVLWSTRVGKGSALGGIHWGMATDGRLVYAANADRAAVIVDVNPERALSPGLYALDLMNGRVVWSAPAPADTCSGRQNCFAANSAAPTVMPGVVFAGGLDGHMRAYATADGRVLWDFDTAKEFPTVNGVPGRGGAIDGPGPVVAGGLLFVNSGYGSFGQMPGNLLLAFGPPRR
ncbi:MAG: PQQ-binding-like beta-propeller repeat protein [Gemmatimonadota bacterium]